jgi:hypothetical protein
VVFVLSEAGKKKNSDNLGITRRQEKRERMRETSPLNRAIGIVATTTTLSGLILQCESFMYTVAS